MRIFLLDKELHDFVKQYAKQNHTSVTQQSSFDAGWYSFSQILAAKAEEAGRKVVKVDPKFTSQACSNCGAIVEKELSERWHSCECGCSLHRDVKKCW